MFRPTLDSSIYSPASILETWPTSYTLASDGKDTADCQERHLKKYTHELMCAHTTHNTRELKSVKTTRTQLHAGTISHTHTHTHPYTHCGLQESLQQTAMSASDWQLKPNPLSPPLMIEDGGNQEERQREGERDGVCRAPMGAREQTVRGERGGSPASRVGRWRRRDEQTKRVKWRKEARGSDS